MDLEAIPVALVLVDRSGRIIGTNQRAARALGRGPAELVGVELVRCFVGVHEWPDAGDADGTTVRDARAVGADVVVDVVFGPTAGDGRRWVALAEASDRAALRSEMDRLRAELAQAERERSRAETLGSEIAAQGAQAEIVGASGALLRMLDEVYRVAASSATVLIHGESGSGKELVARTIHARSPRAARPMVALNCAAIPETLLESELFGHERGAFTGADRQRMGKFELADGSTLFLDEVAELSPAAQAKLLRVLQERAFTRVGGSETIHSDVRLIAATHRDLAMRVRRGMFREDLFYRLNVFKIEVPPLRDRAEDIAALAAFLHEKHARRLAREVVPISERSVRRMLAYRWPGNVRELENAIERATLLATGPELEVELPDTPALSADGAGGPAEPASRDTSAVPRDVLLDLTLDQLQRLQIMHALETRGYRVFGADGAAEKLGINPQTLLSRMVRLGVPRPRAMRRALRGDGPGGAVGVPGD
jgi:transcriptional regulator with GAF, ATPase, and Fis domain